MERLYFYFAIFDEYKFIVTFFYQVIECQRQCRWLVWTTQHFSQKFTETPPPATRFIDYQGRIC